MKKYEELTNLILEQIEKEGLKKGDKLPKVRDIITSTGFSYATVNRTLLEMENDGLITKTQGKGIFVGDLEKKNSKQVAFIIPKDISKGKIFLDLLTGLRRAFEKEGYHLLISISNMSHEKEKLTIERLIEQKIDGLVIFLEDNYMNDYSHIVALKERKFPFVLVDRFIPELATDYVVVSNKGAMVRVCSYLKYKESCDTIIYVTHDDTATSEDEKINGFKDAMKTLYVNDSGLILKCDDFIEKYDELCDSSKKIGLCFFDDLEIAVLKKKLKDNGKSLSSNFRIFGYNNCYEVHNYPTVEQFNDKVGKKAGELLIQRIKNPDAEYSNFRVEPKLVFPDEHGGMFYEN